MNKAEVAKALGISQSTVQRWAKGLKLNIERNQLGHYQFSAHDLEQLKQKKTEMNEYELRIQQANTKKTPRIGTVKLQKKSPSSNHTLVAQIREIERQLENKADSVASYQLLQHRAEIETLKKQIQLMTKRIEALESEKSEEKKKPTSLMPLVFNDKKSSKKHKRHIFQILFGF